MNDIASEYFNCTDRERAAFELGIKLGAIVHQFSGTPLGSGNLQDIERAMEKTLMEMPYVSRASVKIRPPRNDGGTYAYSVLSEDMLDIAVEIDYNGTKARGGMRYIESLGYPLMYIDSMG